MPTEPPERPFMFNKWHVQITRDVFRRSDEYSLDVWGYTSDNLNVITPPEGAGLWVLHNLKSADEDPNFWGRWGKPILKFDIVVGLAIMDELWRQGIRPTALVRGFEGKEDLRFHLEDMRAIVFHHLTIDPPEKKIVSRG